MIEFYVFFTFVIFCLTIIAMVAISNGRDEIAKMAVLATSDLVKSWMKKHRSNI